MNQYPGYNVQPNRPLTCLRNAIMAIGIIGFIIWIVGLGFAGGFYFKSGSQTINLNSFLLVVVHAAYIFITSEILYLITYGVTFSNDYLRRLRGLTSKLLAATIIGVGVSVSTILGMAGYGEDSSDSIFTAFCCSFSYFWTIILFICTTIFNARSHAMMKSGGVAQATENMQLPMTATPGMPQQPMATAASHVEEVLSGRNSLLNMQPQSRASYAPSDRIGPPIPPRVHNL